MSALPTIHFFFIYKVLCLGPHKVAMYLQEGVTSTSLFLVAAAANGKTVVLQGNLP